jgi:hypothetical protein
VVDKSVEGLEKELEPRSVVVGIGKREDVLEQEGSGARLIKDPDIVLQEGRSGIEATALVFKPVTRLRERGARRATDEKVNVAGPEASSSKDLRRVDRPDVSFKNRCGREVCSQ